MSEINISIFNEIETWSVYTERTIERTIIIQKVWGFIVQNMFRQIPRINNSPRPRNRDCFFLAQVQNATNHWHGAKCRAFYSIASSLQERDVFVANEGVNLIASVILRVHSAATPQRVLVTRILCRWLAPEQTDRGSSKPGNINIYRLPKWPEVYHSNMEIDFLFFNFFFCNDSRG